MSRQKWQRVATVKEIPCVRPGWPGIWDSLKATFTGRTAMLGTVEIACFTTIKGQALPVSRLFADQLATALSIEFAGDFYLANKGTV